MITSSYSGVGSGGVWGGVCGGCVGGARGGVWRCVRGGVWGEGGGAGAPLRNLSFLHTCDLHNVNRKTVANFHLSTPLKSSYANVITATSLM